MTYDYYMNLIRVAYYLDSEEQLLGEIGYPQEVNLNVNDYIEALHIIFMVSKQNSKELFSKTNLKVLSKRYNIKYRTLQDWKYRNTIPEHVLQLFGYAMIGNLNTSK